MATLGNWLGLRTGTVFVPALLLPFLTAGGAAGQAGETTGIEGPAVPRAAPSGGQREFSIHYRDGLLTVDLVEAPTQEVFGEITRQTGVTILGAGTLKASLTATFENVPLDDGLRRLVGRWDYVLFYASNTPIGDDRDLSERWLSAVVIHSGRTAVTPRRPEPRQGVLVQTDAVEDGRLGEAAEPEEHFEEPEPEQRPEAAAGSDRL